MGATAREETLRQREMSENECGQGRVSLRQRRECEQDPSSGCRGPLLCSTCFRCLIDSGPWTCEDRVRVFSLEPSGVKGPRE
jgi:hypothetical protein